jgi:hypothetical protein
VARWRVGWRHLPRAAKKGRGHERTLFDFVVPGVRGWRGIQGQAQCLRRRIRGANLGCVCVSVNRPNILHQAAELDADPLFGRANEPEDPIHMIPTLFGKEGI